ncbi:MAG: MBOAT family O-acyltransferase, partial [Oscillospiraceae bacterium]
MLLSVIINLSLLAVFKYSDMFVGTINSIIGTNIPLPNIPLPIGISFYTFQSMSYTIDMYRDNIKVQKNLISYATYVSLFPQIVAGPIVRYEDVQNEIDTRKINIDLISQGIGIFLKGLAKKMLIANNIGALWSIIKIQNLNEMPALTAWLGILAFTFQIYYDFSGYSDMAVGLGKMLGFNFPENFNFPYMAKSISEFWRRWHITLGSWFKSYVYFPLGGNRKGKYQTIINISIVLGVTGLCHGEICNFFFLGLYFLFIIKE